MKKLAYIITVVVLTMLVASLKGNQQFVKGRANAQTATTIKTPATAAESQPVAAATGVASTATQAPSPPATEQVPPQAVQVSGGAEGILQQAGVPREDWSYADCVIDGCEGVSAEGSWQGVTRWNSGGSGAYGICQALPAQKMASAGADWETNPVTQMRWCDTYAHEYGSWAEAWAFRKCVGYCYSTRAKLVVYKDHHWW